MLDKVTVAVSTVLLFLIVLIMSNLGTALLTVGVYLIFVAALYRNVD